MTWPVVVPDNTNYTLAAAITASQGYTGGIVAKAGGTQAAAVQLTTTYNEVTTVASANDSVALPLATALGAEIVLISKSATSMQVYGAVGSTDTINGTAYATGVALVGSATGKTGRYICDKVAPAGNWVYTPAT